jgi:hypothetical protein
VVSRVAVTTQVYWLCVPLSAPMIFGRGEGKEGGPPVVRVGDAAHEPGLRGGADRPAKWVAFGA